MVVHQFNWRFFDHESAIGFYNFIQYRVNLFNCVESYEAVAEFFYIGKTFQVVSIMPAHFVYANDRPFPFHAFVEVLAGNIHSFFCCWRSKMFTSVYKMFDLVEDPWIADSSAADHNAINTITVFISKRFFRAVYITISEDRDLNARVILHFADQRPIGLAFIHLCTCKPMDRKSFDEQILQTFSYFFNI